MKTYTLWLEPTGRTHELLATTIAHLSQEHGGPLAGQEETVLQQTEQLANALSPVDLILTIPVFQDQHFQCVFMRIEETSTLLDAHACANGLPQGSCATLYASREPVVRIVPTVSQGADYWRPAYILERSVYGVSGDRVPSRGE